MDKDSITVSWQRPEGCFDGYIVEVAEENAGSSGVGGLSVGSCAGGISVDAEHTSITCRKIEACSVKITVRTQRKGPHELTSSGVSLHDIVMYKKAFVDFDLYLDRVTTTTAEIIIDPHLPPSCSPRYCGAYICRFYKSGAIVKNCWGEECEARKSYSSEMVVNLKHLTPGGFHTCRVTLRYNNEVAKQIGFNAIQWCRQSTGSSSGQMNRFE
ncbi:hypothetical protein MRX96_042902 [Rhipicephalus microplus]